ncbi:MAG: hypothetical protein M3O30_18980 [Planctomycetota bacterium]|nr:hypothetical protein [Planctomycetota bacterium]
MEDSIASTEDNGIITRKTWVSLNDPEYLRQRHHFLVELLQNVTYAAVPASQAGK